MFCSQERETSPSELSVRYCKTGSLVQQEEQGQGMWMDRSFTDGEGVLFYSDSGWNMLFINLLMMWIPFLLCLDLGVIFVNLMIRMGLS